MVGGTPKPFACTSEGCTMTFTNEDHLNVHQRKHEMVLNLGIKSCSIVADQTPTPTRFLRNCEEVGLFQDLQNVNPFEETFRRAVEMVKTGSLPVPDLPEDDTLHTPHVFPHIAEENVSCIYNTQSLKNNKIELSTENNITRSIGLTVESINTAINDKDLTKNESVLTLSNNSNSPDHMYAITSINTNKTPTILINDKLNLSFNDSANRVYSYDSKTTKFHSKSDLKKAKADLVVREKKFTRTKYKKYLNQTNVNLSGNDGSAKQRLQQILQKKQIKPANEKNIIHVQGLKLANSNKIMPLNVSDLTILPHLQTVSPDLPIFPKYDPITVPATTQNVTLVQIRQLQSNNTKINKNNSEANDTKKLDLLERNRAAATRCRARKKEYFDSIEHKHKIVCKEKEDLQKENINLKNEIQHLKALLLAHKDCPVTKAMNMGQNIPIGPPQIVTIQVIDEEQNDEIANTIHQNPDIKNVVKPNICIANQSKPSVIVLNDALISKIS